MARGESPGHEALYWRSIYNEAIRSGEWKVVVTTDGAPNVPAGESQVQLYSLASDSSERTDLSSLYPRVVVDLMCRLTTWKSGLAAPLWPPVVDFWIDVRGRRYRFAI